MRIIISGKLIMAIATIAVLLIGVNMNLYAEGPKEAKPVLNRWGRVSEGFQLSARLEKELVGPCEPVILVVVMRNASKGILSLAESSPERDYKFVVKDDQGASIPLTRYGKRLMDSTEEFRLVTLKMKSQEEIRSEILINRIYDMTLSSTYSIIVKRNVFRQDGKGLAEVISNVVKVKIAQH